MEEEREEGEDGEKVARKGEGGLFLAVGERERGTEGESKASFLLHYPGVPKEGGRREKTLLSCYTRRKSLNC